MVDAFCPDRLNGFNEAFDFQPVQAFFLNGCIDPDRRQGLDRNPPTPASAKLPQFSGHGFPSRWAEPF
jgi:hypothetical protein